jgi:putative restriction endonuclease
MGRTPSSLALKLVNFASLDPVLAARGIVGMPGVSEQDRLVWREFHDNLSTLGPESEQLLHDLITTNQAVEVDFLQPEKLRLEPSVRTLNRVVTEATALVKVRRGQQFFRQSILSAYDVRCCISGINVPDLLVASHIRPWSEFPDDRLDPSNGLCLSSLHDSAFDAGLITLDQNRVVVLSSRLRSYFPQSLLEQNFVPFEGKEIRLPQKLAEPSEEHLAYHRKVIFKP